MSASLAVTQTAVIIPFPVRHKSPAPAPQAVVVVDENDPQARLAAALAKLNEALNAQKKAVADWRDSLGSLKGSVQGLHGSLSTYNEKLGELGAGVQKIGDDSRATIARMDEILNKDK